MEEKYSNHELAITEIAKELNLPRAQVSDLIVHVLFYKIGTHLRFPNIIKIPYLGKLVPDMRRYRHHIAREEKLTKIKQQFKI